METDSDFEHQTLVALSDGEWRNAADLPGGLATCYRLMNRGLVVKRDQELSWGAYSYEWQITPAGREVVGDGSL